MIETASQKREEAEEGQEEREEREREREREKRERESWHTYLIEEVLDLLSAGDKRLVKVIWVIRGEPFRMFSFYTNKRRRNGIFRKEQIQRQRGKKNEEEKKYEGAPQPVFYYLFTRWWVF